MEIKINLDGKSAKKEINQVFEKKYLGKPCTVKMANQLDAEIKDIIRKYVSVHIDYWA